MLSSRIFDQIRKAHEGHSFDPMLNEASVMARTCVFKNRPGHAAGEALGMSRWTVGKSPIFRYSASYKVYSRSTTMRLAVRENSDRASSPSEEARSQILRNLG